MTTKKRRPHSCGAYRRNNDHTCRLAWRIANTQTSFETEVPAVVASEKEFLGATTMETPTIASPREDSELLQRAGTMNQFDAIHGKCDGFRSHGLGLREPEYFYLTTNKRDFDGNHGMPAPLTRPKSSKFSPSENKFLSSLYQDEYCKKKGPGDCPIRSGTASGNRKNNPHPLESFMIWKFPGRLPPVEQMKDINTNAMEIVSKESLKSTYQMDYIGIRQGDVNELDLTHVPCATTSGLPKYTLDSTSRFEYQQPKLHESLKNNTTRYGCNARKCVPAIGAVPNVSAKVPSLKCQRKTLYAQEYHDKSANAKVSEHVRPIIAKKLNRYLQNQNRERENTARILEKFEDFERSNNARVVSG